MDPATALGVAAAAVQFIEVGLKTLALCKEIRDSETDTTMLHAELQQSTKQLETIQNGVTLTSFPRDTSRSIKQCSQDCSSTAKELQDLLSEIRAIAQKKRFGAARAAFRALKDQKKIEKIQNKLEKCQARFQTAVGVDTREKVLALLKTQGKMSQTLEDVVYPELKRMHVSTQDQISDAQKSSAAAHETTHKALASLNQTSRASKRAILDAGARVEDRLAGIQMSHTQRAFLQSLEHPDMFSRHRQIHAPATGTFEWIFARDSSREHQDTKTKELQGRFAKWLRSSQPVFWINGKAGSGKSSLMSFIESHERTQDLLKIWAGGHRLHVFSFFFWRAGSEMQKSICGVLQSLLYQLARARPEIIGSLTSNEISSLERTWTQARLHRAIEKALSHFSEDRIFVLIDGLDEFEGSHTALTTLILGLQNGSHSKFCLSSRPETALTRQLACFPSLRLQDLNYGDIESFVHGQLKSYENVYGDPWRFREVIRDVSSRAEGIFLWAALVCKSLVSGFESKDDTNMIRQRLETMPAGLEALFALMFSNIDREHREHLSKCFFLLKWSSANDNGAISDVSVPVVTAFLSASPHQSLADFVQDCRLVEHRVIAQARGLLELYQPEMSMFDTSRPDLQKFGLCILSDALSGEPGYRSIRQESSVTEMYPTACIRWVHRSAYDYITGDHSGHIRSWKVSTDETSLLRRLLDAQSWLAQYFPGQHMDLEYAPVARVVIVFHRCTGDLRVSGFESLDKLYDTIQLSYYGGECVGPDGMPAIGSSELRLFIQGIDPLRAFWRILIGSSQGEYLHTRFDRIKRSAFADILCSGIIKDFCFCKSFNHFDASQEECMMPAMTLSFDHLLHQGSMGCTAVATRPTTVPSNSDDTLCLSWSGRGRSIERIMVTDIFSALLDSRQFHPRSVHDAERHPQTGYFLSAQDFGQKLIELAELWQIYFGRRFDSPPFTPLHVHISAREYKRSYLPDPLDRESSDCTIPTWRFLCLGYNEDRKCQWSSGEQVPIVACFDVKAQRSKQLLDRSGKVRCSDRNARVALMGTSEEETLCLETILEEVWADADGQFDNGWQQLYMLACLKKHFGNLWNVPESSDVDIHDFDDFFK